jgi:hypothetical protein
MPVTLQVACRAVLAAGMLGPSIWKWRGRDMFAASLAWLMEEWASPAATAICISEAALAAAVIGFPRWGALAVGVWIVLGTVYLAALLSTTRVAVCDCWRPRARTEHSLKTRVLTPVWYVIRNTLYLGLAIAVYHTSGAGHLEAAVAVPALAFPYVLICLSLVGGIAYRNRMIRGEGDLALQRELRATWRKPLSLKMFRFRRAVSV